MNDAKRPARILAVDDEERNRRLLIAMLGPRVGAPQSDRISPSNSGCRSTIRRSLTSGSGACVSPRS